MDPIRNYDTSPDLQLENPAQAVWRVSREKVAVVNTYNVVPATGTPHIGTAAQQQADDEDDEEADGSEQLTVKSSRTYHTKTGDKHGAHLINTPALTDKASSPVERSLSPEPRRGNMSPRRLLQHPEQQLRPHIEQQGLGISGGGFTPLLRPGEQYAPILYPPQPSISNSYLWSSPDMSIAGAYCNPMPAVRTQYLPNMGIQYASQSSPRTQYPLYNPSPTQYIQDRLPPTPVLRSPRKERAHFNHYTYPPQPDYADLQRDQGPQETPSSPREYCGQEDDDFDEAPTPEYVYANEDGAYTSLPPNRITNSSRPTSPSRTTIPRANDTYTIDARPKSRTSSPKKANRTTKHNPKEQTFTYIIETPEIAQPERRITRSQSKSPTLKSRQLPTISTAPSLPPPAAAATKQLIPVPMHLRGPSLLDEITFDPETGAPMMEASVLASWLGGPPTSNNPLALVSPGHSRETSHVRGESVTQWLNLPQIPE